MKALTIHQPWAELIARGEKLVENRGWRTAYRGPLAIHASAAREYRALAARFGLVFDELPRASIVAVATLVDCVRIEDLAGERPAHAVGPWCWILADVRRLAGPIGCPGRQSLWPVPAAIAERLARA